MKRGNVLVIGNSGVGKSTLINAVLGENRAKIGWGTRGTTEQLEIYESEEIPFRIIDTIGFEPSLLKEFKAIRAVKKWSKESIKKGNEECAINVIWFCVDGTSRKLFAKTITDLSHATAMWKSVPVIVVITKSYAIPDRKENIDLVYQAFAGQKIAKNVKKVIPVVAATYTLNDTAFAPPEGITELIDATNEIMPEGIKASRRDIAEFKLQRKKAFAQSIVGVSTTAAITVGAVPIPFPDATVLSPLEVGEINALAKLYGIENNEDSKRLLNSIVEVGTVSLVAKNVISAVKAIPTVTLSASVLNAIIAGGIVFALGEGSIYVFEKIYLGEKSVTDIDWVTKIMESKLSNQFIDKLTQIAKIVAESDKKNLNKIIADLLMAMFTTPSKNQEYYEGH